MSGLMPHISYVTFVNAFVSLSFVLISATAGINLVVCLCDRHGHFEKGDLVDRRCRWIFPIAHSSIRRAMSCSSISIEIGPVSPAIPCVPVRSQIGWRARLIHALLPVE